MLLADPTSSIPSHCAVMILFKSVLMTLLLVIFDKLWLSCLCILYCICFVCFQLALKYHPDKNLDNPSATEKVNLYFHHPTNFYHPPIFLCFQQALRFHPDKNQNNPAATEKVKSAVLLCFAIDRVVDVPVNCLLCVKLKRFSFI